MAGDWIPMRVDLLDDPAVIAIAAAVGLDEYAVAGRLLKLWSWANRHLRDGHAVVPDKWVDDYLGTAGFAAAMLAAGWLRTRSAGGLEFTSFDRWNSNGAKIRLGETLRKRAFREKKSPAKRVPKVSGTMSRTKQPGSPGPEKRREEKSKEGSANPLPASGAGDHPHKLLFAAVAEVCGIVPDTDKLKRLIGSVASELHGADPPYTPAEVRDFGRRFTSLCTWAARDNPPRSRPTPNELSKWIHKVRAAPETSPPLRPPARDRRAADLDFVADQMASIFDPPEGTDP